MTESMVEAVLGWVKSVIDILHAMALEAARAKGRTLFWVLDVGV